MLFAGWEVRMVKNCDRGLENAAFSRLSPLKKIYIYLYNKPSYARVLIGSHL